MASSNGTNCSLCENSWFVGSLILQAALGTAGLTCNLFFVSLLAGTKLFDFSVRTLLSNISAALALLSAYFIAKSCVTLYYISTYGMVFPILSAAECNLVDMGFCVAVQVTNFSFFCLSLERAYAATLYRKDGESARKMRGYLCTLCLILCFWLISVVIVASYFAFPITAQNYCNGLLASNKYLMILVLIFHVVCQVLAVVIYVHVWNVSRRQLISFAINQAQLTLTHRVQLRRSIEVTEMLLPSVLLQATCQLTATIMLLVDIIHFRTQPLFSDRELTLSQYFHYTIFAIHMVAHPIVCVLRSPKLIDTLRKATGQERRSENTVESLPLKPLIHQTSQPARKKSHSHGGGAAGGEIVVQDDPCTEADLRFEELTDMWNREFKSRRTS